jgi:hypothetical protein
MKVRTALIEVLKGSKDLRTLFKRGSKESAFRLRAQAWQFREELTKEGYVVPLDAVEDALFGLARDLFPESPAADFSAWAELLYRDALARIQEHFTTLSANQKDAVDLTEAWRHSDAIDEACRNEDLSALREALKDYEREARAAIQLPKKESGAA